MRLISFFSFILLLAACAEKKSEEKKPITVSSHNTEVNEWINIPTIKPYSDSHSANTVSVIDSSSIYSLGYQNSLGNISKSKINSVVFSYWVLIKSDKAQAKTVLSIDDTISKKNIAWIGNPVKQKINVKEKNKWTEITETFEIPKNANPKYLLKLYVLNDSKEEILLDDFKVAFY